MTPFILAQILGALRNDSQPASPATDPVVLAQIVEALAKRDQPAPTPTPLPEQTGSGVVEGIVIAAYIVAMFGTAALGIYMQSPITALAVLAFGLGVLASKFGTVVDYRFGSSWGSRQKDAWRPSGRQGTPVVVPALHAPPAPQEPTGGPSASEDNPAMQIDNFPRVHEVIAKWEGGYSDHPSDPGGATNYGITIGVLGEWRGRKVTKADVKALTYDEALKIFRARYWEPLQCAEMPVAVALMVYNAGVNSGIARGAKFLQECINKQGVSVNVDGAVGPLTLAAISKADPARLVDDYAATYEAFYRSLKTFPTFGKGWLNRLADVTATAKKWPAVQAPSQPAEQPHTGAALVALARKFIGRAYAHALVPKDDADYSGAFDCAELASYVVYQVTGRLYGCTDNSAAPSAADAYTGAWKRDAHSLGKIITVAEAARTPGAFVLRYPPSGGSMGHIALSAGDGTTVEAKSTAEGVVADKVSGRRWDIGVIIPWIDYGSGNAVTVAGPTKVYGIGQPNMSVDKVKEIQTAIAKAGYDAGAVDGEYGPKTAAGVVEFQRSRGLVEDGEVGPQTAAALGVTL